jgi:hypothetical protein
VGGAPLTTLDSFGDEYGEGARVDRAGRPLVTRLDQALNMRSWNEAGNKLSETQRNPDQENPCK